MERQKVIQEKDETDLENADNKNEKDFFRKISAVFMNNSD